MKRLTPEQARVYERLLVNAGHLNTQAFPIGDGTLRLEVRPIGRPQRPATILYTPEDVEAFLAPSPPPPVPAPPEPVVHRAYCRRCEELTLGVLYCQTCHVSRTAPMQLQLEAS